jgi:hypothetical protein
MTPLHVTNGDIVVDHLRRAGLAPDALAWEYPGIAHFGGLGELEPGQFPGLLEVATPLTAEAFDLGAAAWAALRAADPGGLAAIAASRSPELRFLGEALDRLGREYPSSRDGLSLTERRLLAATGAEDGRGGEPDAGAVFARLGQREARPFLADLFCFRILARLAGGRVPLVELDPPAGEVAAGTRLRLTAAGGSRAAGRGRPGGPQRHRPLGRGRPPPRTAGPLALGRGHRVGHPRGCLISPDPGDARPGGARQAARRDFCLLVCLLVQLARQPQRVLVLAGQGCLPDGRARVVLLARG